jgi:CheY-like chemotaxis protein
VLVEDNPADVRLVRKALEEHQVEGELTLLMDGEKAISFIDAVDSQSAACPDLIIIDLNLPRRSGREVLEHMRRSTRCGDVPVVILSSSDIPRDRDECRRFGASRYIRKPSRLDEFLAIGAILKGMLTQPEN